jgi:hypothetical protein
MRKIRVEEITVVPWKRLPIWIRGGRLRLQWERSEVAKDEDWRVLERRKVKEEDDANGLGNEESECDCIFLLYLCVVFLSILYSYYVMLCSSMNDSHSLARSLSVSDFLDKSRVTINQPSHLAFVISFPPKLTVLFIYYWAQTNTNSQESYFSHPTHFLSIEC